MSQRPDRTRTTLPKPNVLVSLLVIVLSLAVVGLSLFALFTYSIEVRIRGELTESVMPGNSYNRGTGTVAPSFPLVLAAVFLVILAVALLSRIIHTESRIVITLVICAVALVGTVLTARYTANTESALIEFGREQHRASGLPPKNDVQVVRDATWSYLPFAFASLAGVSLVSVFVLDRTRRREQRT